MPSMVFSGKDIGMRSLLFQINDINISDSHINDIYINDYEWYTEKAKSVTLLNATLRFKKFIVYFPRLNQIISQISYLYMKHNLWEGNVYVEEESH